MDRRSSRFLVRSRRTSRFGVSYLGALREILIVSAVAGLVLAILSDTGSLFQSRQLTQDQNATQHAIQSVLSLDVDQDRNSVVVHCWPGQFNEIRLNDGQSNKLPTPRNLVSAAASETNSTTILLSQWFEENSVENRVLIVRDKEIVLSESLVFDQEMSGEARISADGRTAVVVGFDGHVVGWDLASAEPVRWEYSLGQSIDGSGLSPDGLNLFVATSQGTNKIVDLRTGDGRREFPNSISRVTCVSWSRDSRRMALGFQSGELFVFDSQSGRKLWSHQLSFLFPKSVALTANGDHIAVGGFSRTLHVWNVNNANSEPTILDGESSLVHKIKFASSDTMLLTGGSDGTVREWSLSDQKMTRQLR